MHHAKPSSRRENTAPCKTLANFVPWLSFKEKCAEGRGHAELSLTLIQAWARVSNHAALLRADEDLSEDSGVQVNASTDPFPGSDSAAVCMDGLVPRTKHPQFA